jgi:hypothetical protein
MTRSVAWRIAAFSTFCVALVVAAAARAGDASPNDTAHFLAGMPVSAGSPLEPLTKEKEFTEYSEAFDKAWSTLQSAQIAKVKSWSAENLKTPRSTLFYTFAGPDFLYADAFFPKAETYILVGLELPGEIPNIEALQKRYIPHELQAVRTSINSVMNYSFFITSEMSSHLYNRREFMGTLPVLYVFLARTGKTIESVTLVELDKEGIVRPATPPEPQVRHRRGRHEQQPQLTRGVKIVFTGESKQQQTLYYFSTDLSNRGVENSGFLKFCEQWRSGDALIKSASYLLHNNEFSQVRNFLLSRSAAIVQDDTGVPLKDYDLGQWDLRPFGNYIRPIPIFSGYLQKDLVNFFTEQHAQPLEFNIGYQWKNNGSSVLLATKKPGRREEASSEGQTSMAGAAKGQQ